MKARVKATGEIVEVAYHGLGVYVDMNKWDGEYNFDEIIILDNGDPDYWTKLEHQYAGMAMQGMLANANHYLWERKQNYKSLVANAAELARALVEKLKSESNG